MSRLHKCQLKDHCIWEEPLWKWSTDNRVNSGVADHASKINSFLVVPNINNKKVNDRRSLGQSYWEVSNNKTFEWFIFNLVFLPSQYLNLYLMIIFLHRFMYILIHQYCIHTKCKSKEKRKISCRSIWGRFFTKWVGHPAPNTHNIERLEMTEIVQKILFLHSLSYKCITKDPSSLYSILVLDGIK